ncbi:MAG TPA: hypothetical protein VN457_05230, partial [Chlamydiales bacterium]|nr:hypothetical protein [Chlamydiales bacterium]
MVRHLFLILFCYSFSFLSAADFTIASYNCGCLGDHYDYLRAAAMQKLMQERYNREPALMSVNEKMQALALKIRFSEDPMEKLAAQNEWDRKGYDIIFKQMTANPTAHTTWAEKVDKMITNYKIRPIMLHDLQVNAMFSEQLLDLAKDTNAIAEQLIKETRNTLLKRQMLYHMQHDIICLQEADYANQLLFPETYNMLFSKNEHSKNGIAWDKSCFELVDTIGDILGRGFAVVLRHKESGKKVLVASGHLTGCDPYVVRKATKKELTDSAKGDHELAAMMELFEKQSVDMMLIGMDGNVTSFHPRMDILKNYGYRLDYENYLEQTCTNPHYVLNTRIDWIAAKTTGENKVKITNIPVLSIGLNTIQTN